MNVRERISKGKYKNKTKLPHCADCEGERKKIWARHRDEDIKLEGLLKSDLEKEHGVVGHKKAVLLFQLAWQNGHASGFEEVCGYYEEFVELIK